MPSKRLRSKRTIAAAVTNLSSSVARVEQVSVPYQISPLALSGDAFDQDSIRTDAIASGAISSKSLGLSAYVPNGEGTQRVPAPLTDLEYWGDVVEGLIELHRSGIHDNEDIQNVSATTSGLVFSPTGVAVDPETGATGEARVYLTGRLPIPRSRVIYATWRSTANIPIKLVWWTSATPIKVVKASISSSVVTFTTESAHGFAVNDDVKVTGCGAEFNGVYTVTSATGTEGETTVFTAAANSTAPTDVNETTFAIEGLVSLETFTYVELENKLSWTAPDAAGEYAVYAELAYDASERTLSDAKVFEVIGSGKSDIVAANVNNYVITSNVITYTTDATHTFQVDDIVSVGYTPEETIAAANCQVTSGTPNVLTVRFSSAHKFHTGYEVSLDLSPTVFNGTYSIVAVPNTTAINLSTTLNTTPVTSTTGNVSAVTSPLSGQAKITATTSNTFNIARANVQDVSSTSVTATLAEVGRPRYSYITYIATNIASTYIDVYTENPHGFAVGETVNISGAPSATFPGVDGSYTIASATDRYFRITTTPESDVSITALTAKQALAYIGSSDFSVQVGPEGFKFIGSGDESVDTDLGTTSDNFITLSRIDGQVLSSIDNQGIGTFRSISTDEVVIDGANLMGSFSTATYNGATYTGDYLDRLSRGVIYRGAFTVTGSTAVATKFFSLAYGTFKVEEGRHYLITATTGGMRATATQNAVFELIMSTEPLRADNPGTRHLNQLLLPSVHSDLAPMVGFFTAEAYTPATNLSISSISRSTTTVSVTTSTAHGLAAGDFVGVSGTSNTLFHGTFEVATVVNTVAFTYTTESSGTITALTSGTVRKVSSLLSQAGKLPAGVDIYWALRLRHGTAPTSYTLSVVGNPANTPQMELTVADMGQAKTSVDVTQVGLSSTLMELNPTDGGGGGSNTVTTYTATETVYASSSAYYDNYGKGTGTTDPYAYKYSLYQGNPGTASGTKKSAVVFPVFASPPAGATNVTVTKVEVYLRNRHSYNSGGLTAYIATHSTASLGSSIPGISNYGVVSASFTKGQGKWVTLPSGSYTAFKPGTQTARGIILGATDDDPDTFYGSIANYGYFDGNTMSDEPRLKITYTYEL